jgi:hypothetical protein
MLLSGYTAKWLSGFSLSSGFLRGCLLLVAGAGPAHAEVLLANDDSYGIPYGEALIVEAFGVLDNDALDGENAGESGVTVELVTNVTHGVLTLATNGSFTYAPGPEFDGIESFVYRAVFSTNSSEATVALTACTGGPQIFTCWKEAAFLAKAAALGHPSFQEGFEDNAVWGGARSPTSTLSVSSRGIKWRANDFDPSHSNPPPNRITTGPGPARTGSWGVFDPEHGYAWGTEGECDIDNPDAHCHYHDGFTITREPGSSAVHGAGGYFTGIHGARVAFVLNGDYTNPIGGGVIGVGEHQFFGVVDANPTGWNDIQFREIDGKIGQALFIFGDDFTVLSTGLEPSTPGTPGTLFYGR